jgi:1-deoxy-D-xylulose-5-phosphate synthase
VIVHAITRKGHGYAPAENDEADRFHATGIIDPETGRPVAAAERGWTGVFADEMLRIGERRPDVVGITAAMLIPVGLHRFAERYPGQVFDVGIAEQHAVTSAAGMAFGGLHPVVTVYATFLSRPSTGLMDVALHGGVTFVLDRAGITGDVASHHGIWDLSILQVVPGIRIAAPRDGATLRAELGEAVEVDDVPTVVRFAKGAPPEDIPALGRIGGMDLLRRAGSEESSWSRSAPWRSAGRRGSAGAQGIGVSVVDALDRPGGRRLAGLAARHRLVASSRTSGSAGSGPWWHLVDAGWVPGCCSSASRRGSWFMASGPRCWTRPG